MQSDSQTAGADYATLPDRLPQVDLTDAEKINLVTTIHAVLDSRIIAWERIEEAFADVFGAERGAGYMENLRTMTPGGRWSSRENVRMVAALYPHIPGETEDAKASWLVERAAPCFNPERWEKVVFPFVLQRVEEYKAAGGTLYRWPEVVPQTTDPTLSSDIPAGTRFLHADVSAWPVTARLDASISGGNILMPYDKAKVWPAVDGCNANPWVIVYRGGEWISATFEWLRMGQTSKPMGVIDGSMGDHIKVSPLDAWRPTSGEIFGLMVSGLARSNARNVKERSNVSWVVCP